MYLFYQSIVQDVANTIHGLAQHLGIKVITGIDNGVNGLQWVNSNPQLIFVHNL